MTELYIVVPDYKHDDVLTNTHILKNLAAAVWNDTGYTLHALSDLQGISIVSISDFFAQGKDTDVLILGSSQPVCQQLYAAGYHNYISAPSVRSTGFRKCGAITRCIRKLKEKKKTVIWGRRS